MLKKNIHLYCFNLTQDWIVSHFPQKYEAAQQFSTLIIIRNVSSAYYYDFWRSCDSEDCSNDADNSAAHHRNKLHFTIYSHRRQLFKIVTLYISQYCLLYFSSSKLSAYSFPQLELYFLKYSMTNRKTKTVHILHYSSLLDDTRAPCHMDWLYWSISRKSSLKLFTICHIHQKRQIMSRICHSFSIFLTL